MGGTSQPLLPRNVVIRPCAGAWSPGGSAKTLFHQFAWRLEGVTASSDSGLLWSGPVGYPGYGTGVLTPRTIFFTPHPPHKTLPPIFFLFFLFFLFPFLTYLH